MGASAFRGRDADTLRAVLFLFFGAVVALCVPLFSKGSYARLLETRWRWHTVLALGVVLQVLVERLPRDQRQLAFGMLIASYVLLLGFCFANLLHTGMAVVAIGIAANFCAIAVNTGMPVAVPADWRASGGVADTVKHHPERSSDRLHWLGDVIVVRRLNEAVSFGDLIIIVGLCDVAFHASRRRRRRRNAPPALDITEATALDTTLPELVEQLELAGMRRRTDEAAELHEPEPAGRR